MLRAAIEFGSLGFRRDGRDQRDLAQKQVWEDQWEFLLVFLFGWLECSLSRGRQDLEESVCGASDARSMIYSSNSRQSEFDLLERP